MKQTLSIPTVAAGVRRRVLEHILRHGGGYMSQACSSAETLATLYLRVMRLGPSTMPMVPPAFGGVPGENPAYQSGEGWNGPVDDKLDRLIFSPAHYALVLYALLIELGRMSSEGLAQFNLDGSTVEMIGAEHSPGMATTTGSLGQAISQASGIALGRKLKGAKGKVWCYMSDGEFAEGQTWEALAAGWHLHLDNLTILVDYNRQTCDGAMKDTLDLEPLARRIKGFNASVTSVNAHDPQAIARACKSRHPGRVRVILCESDPCHGLELLRQRAPRLHYLRFTSAEEKAAYATILNTWNQEGNIA